MKNIHAAAAALLLAAFVLCGCSAGGRVSTAKDGIIRDEREGAYSADKSLEDNIIEDDDLDGRDAGVNENGRVKNDLDTGSAANKR